MIFAAKLFNQYYNRVTSALRLCCMSVYCVRDSRSPVAFAQLTKQNAPTRIISSHNYHNVIRKLS